MTPNNIYVLTPDIIAQLKPTDRVAFGWWSPADGYTYQDDGFFNQSGVGDNVRDDAVPAILIRDLPFEHDLPNDKNDWAQVIVKGFLPSIMEDTTINTQFFQTNNPRRLNKYLLFSYDDVNGPKYVETFAVVAALGSKFNGNAAIAARNFSVQSGLLQQYGAWFSSYSISPNAKNAAQWYLNKFIIFRDIALDLKHKAYQAKRKTVRANIIQAVSAFVSGDVSRVLSVVASNSGIESLQIAAQVYNVGNSFINITNFASAQLNSIPVDITPDVVPIAPPVSFNDVRFDAGATSFNAIPDITPISTIITDITPEVSPMFDDFIDVSAATQDYAMAFPDFGNDFPIDNFFDDSNFVGLADAGETIGGSEVFDQFSAVDPKLSTDYVDMPEYDTNAGEFTDTELVSGNDMNDGFSDQGSGSFSDSAPDAPMDSGVTTRDFVQVGGAVRSMTQRGRNGNVATNPTRQIQSNRAPSSRAVDTLANLGTLASQNRNNAGSGLSTRSIGDTLRGVGNFFGDVSRGLNAVGEVKKQVQTLTKDARATVKISPNQSRILSSTNASFAGQSNGKVLLFAMAAIGVFLIAKK